MEDIGEELGKSGMPRSKNGEQNPLLPVSIVQGRHGAARLCLWALTETGDAR